MNKLKYITPICIVLYLFIVNCNTVFAFSFGPPKQRTGAPNENTCATAGCHIGNSLNAPGGSLVLTVPKTYEPGEVYDIVVNLSRNGQRRWGFQMTALNENNVGTGSFKSIDANTQLNRSDNKYIEHTAKGTAQGTRNMHSWMFEWTAPANDVGPITFYAAGNAANNASGAGGDYIYTQSATSEVPFHGVSLKGIGNLTRKTTDASSGINYTVQVRNTGNISDTINLTTSGNVSATLNRNSVSLNAGASTNVTVSISGSALTAAGEYEVDVKATSQGDTTKTAEVTTTTTILPVYSIALTGVGDLTTKTSDASAGVSYRVRVTNNGNTRDTISLTTSGDVNATLSPSTIALNRGSSRTVTLRISGTVLTAAGEYEVKVKATSKGDDIISPEITTTTTILPVYSISLAGVGDLETETSDAGNGVVYKLNITNDGNTADVIDLSTSGDAVGTLSADSVSLASGASKEVTLTISADGLTLAGEYEVKMAATSEGDDIISSEITTTTTILPVYSISLAGVGDLETETSDAGNGVVYKLNITNDGNTADVIDLSTSGDAAGTLSADSVSLASGASKEVTLTISADDLTLAGEYEVKMAATSEGDGTISAEISTTTTILPVYSISLAGVGDLEVATSDASDGVVYKLNITNDGNTADVIDLSTSGDAAGTLSADSVSLASGASKEVTLTISADELMLAGDYDVKVKATSQGDGTISAEISTTTTILPVYDVSIAGVGDLETETTDASDGVVYKLNITNDGNTADVIDLSTSGDAAGTLSADSVSLASGASKEVTLTISADDLTLAGEYDVKVKATSQGDGTISVEISTTTTILPVYSISLAGVGDLETETTDASDGVVYKLNITNDGNTADVIDLSTSGDAAGTLSADSVSLASGASKEVTLTISADDLTLAGEYEVKMAATSEGDGTISAEISTTTTILPVYSISLAGVGDLEVATSDASDGVVYKLRITNDGNTDDVIDLSTSGDAAGTLSADSVSLASGASKEVTLTISADDLTLAGEYDVKVKATSQGDGTISAEISMTTTILPVYSISLAGVGDLETETTDASDGVVYKLRITNDGNTADVIDLSTSGDAAGTLSADSVSLASGASKEVTLTISADDLTLAGEYDVKVKATSQGDGTISVEISTTTTILPVYSISLAGVGDLEVATSDASDGVVYKLNITNDGNTDDVIDLSTSGDAAGTLSADSVSLASGASKEVTLTISADDLMLAGEYEVKMAATSEGDGTISVEISTTTTILPVYSISLAGVGDLETETTDASDGVVYKLRITNDGNTADVIDLSTSGDAAGTLSDDSVSLASGASKELTLTISADDLTLAGAYDVKVTATSQSETTKTAEITTTTTILPVYGFSIEGVGDLETDTSDAGDGVSYKLRITNDGNTADVIDLSTSGDADATLSADSVSLASGASAEVTLTISADGLTLTGEYDVKVTAILQGDNTISSEVSTATTILPVYDVMLEIEGTRTGTTTDAVEGITYTLKVTNSGNIEDTIRLGSSAEVGISGAVLGAFSRMDAEGPPTSQLEITLAPGVTEDVLFIASGDLLTQPGGYEIEVTATSKGDSTISAAITTSTTIAAIPPVYGVTLQGEGGLSESTMGSTLDILTGITYTLIVTNTGNTEDTILIGSSAEFGIEGSVLGSIGLSDTQESPASQLEIVVASDASETVLFTVSGDAFTKSGEYEITVTATSQGDNTKTAELTTTTTVTPIYSVQLEGKDALTGETMDAVKGVNYVLIVSNDGNTDDTVVLRSSAQVGIEGSVLGYFTASSDQETPLSEIEVMLSPGTSTEVTFTAAGDLFTISGKYEITVTATSQGDNTKTAELTTTTTVTPIYSVQLEGKDALTGETMDAVKGVNYVLIVSNDGNTDDTVVLRSSAQVGIEGSVLGYFTASSDQETPLSEIEVMLSPGTSTEVTFTAAGDLFTISGEYEITVTATSQGDNTKTAELTTTTTVTPIYSVQLEGKDALTGETMDAVKGVNYVLIVSNDGNTDDTVVLRSSAQVGIEGSVLGYFTASSDQETPLSEIEVMLSPGTSTEVTFTAAGDLFTISGEYEITVTATSQGDNTKTAELTTTTTVTPIYSVQLEGKDALIGETMDAVKGVNYVLIVSNDGNTDDTVVLRSSAEFGIEGNVHGSFTASSDQEPSLSEIEVMLSPGTSTEVTFTAAGDLFTKPGEYEIVVTATSKADVAQTTELRITTTISPVPWDINADGAVNILDLVQVTKQFGESGAGLIGDVNMDGQVNILDLVQIALYIGKTHGEIVQEMQ